MSQANQSLQLQQQHGQSCPQEQLLMQEFENELLEQWYGLQMEFVEWISVSV